MIYNNQKYSLKRYQPGALVKKTSVCISFVLLFFTSQAQNADSLLYKLSREGRDTNRLNIQLDLAKFYLFKPGEYKSDLDSSLYYINAVKTLSKILGATDHKLKAIILDGQLSMEKGDTRRAEDLFTEVAGYYQRTGDSIKEASVWDLLGESIYFADLPKLELRLKSFQKAYDIYRKIKSELLAAQELNKVGDVYLNLGKLDRAETVLTEVIQKFKLIKYPKIYQAYYLLGEVFSQKHDYLNEIFCRIDCVRAFDADKNRNESEGLIYYPTLATKYEYFNKSSKSIIYYQKTLDLGAKVKDHLRYYTTLYSFMFVYINKKEYRKGLQLAQLASKKLPPETDEEKEFILSGQLLLYNYLHEEIAASKIVPEFKRVFMIQYGTLHSFPKEPGVNTFILLYKPLLDYYVQTRQWEKLDSEIKLFDNLKNDKITQLSKVYMASFKLKLDSVNGNFYSALRHSQWIKKILDSLSVSEIKKQPNQFDAKIMSLKRDRSIQMLNNEAMLQKSYVSRINTQRNITLGGILISILIAILSYLAYQGKQRTNRRLQEQQVAINEQNDSLSGLLVEKESLIQNLDRLLKQQENLVADKEWLLREVHHRVKNNLQIVMSLLYNQSAYLKNSAAIEALKDSQNRVHAISIIHQKLYNKENVAAVILSEYIRDLVHYLQNSYGTDKIKIRFNQNIDAVQLDISQAVPVGLIVNEAVTNCIKYAFRENGGDIFISGLLTERNQVSLIISDNGAGLPDAFDIEKTTSLGMEMMKALSKQLGGTFEVSSDKGVRISIKFTVDENVTIFPAPYRSI